uniref:Uncharacterized protein n=1 Tax=Rhizophora mucronata TaxID=61149 RepID=A0A2P2N395_RHIMU
MMDFNYASCQWVTPIYSNEIFCS